MSASFRFDEGLVAIYTQVMSRGFIRDAQRALGGAWQPCCGPKRPSEVRLSSLWLDWFNEVES